MHATHAIHKHCSMHLQIHLARPNTTFFYPSMLLSILLVDDETDNGGKVVACHHNATLVSSIIILSLPVFFYTKYRTLKLTVAMGAWRLQQVWITLAAESHKPAHSGPWCDLSFVARNWSGWHFGSCQGNQADSDCLLRRMRRVLRKGEPTKFHFTPLWSASRSRRRIPLKRSKQQEYKESPTHCGRMEC